MSEIDNSADDAIAAYRRSLALNPHHGMAYWSLAELKTLRFGAADVEAMKAAFKEYSPTFDGPITPKNSVDMVLKVIENATVEKYGGEFVSHYGNKQWL